MKKLCIVAVIGLLNFATITKAHDFNHMENGLFAQLGGSYNSVRFDQFLTGVGQSNEYSNDTLVATGLAGGPANPYHDTQSTFAPVATLGYAHKISEDSDWFLGFKFVYRYLGLTFSQDNINSFQVGTYNTVSGTDSFTGHFLVGSYQDTINHEFNFMPFAGYSLTDAYSVYIGVSPVLMQGQSNIYQATGYADINGVHTDITGNPVNFTNAQLLWGGAGEIGINYNLDSRWSLNVSYNYAITQTIVIHNAANFTSETQGTTPYTTIGSFSMDASQRFIAQAISASISMVF